MDKTVKKNLYKQNEVLENAKDTKRKLVFFCKPKG